MRFIEPVRLDRRQQIEGIAVVRDDARPAAPFATRLLPNPQKAHAPPTRRGAVGKALRGLRVVGARGFEPPTFRSRNGRGHHRRGCEPSQACAIDYRPRVGERVQPFAGFGRVSQEFFYPFSTQLERDTPRTVARRPAGGGGGARARRRRHLRAARRPRSPTCRCSGAGAIGCSGSPRSRSTSASARGRSTASARTASCPTCGSSTRSGAARGSGGVHGGGDDRRAPSGGRRSVRAPLGVAPTLAADRILIFFTCSPSG